MWRKVRCEAAGQLRLGRDKGVLEDVTRVASRIYRGWA